MNMTNFSFSIDSFVEDKQFTNIWSTVEWLTFAGFVLATVCLTIHLFVFLLTPGFKNDSGNNFFTLDLALLGSYCCFIGVFFEVHKLGSCQSIMYAKYYFVMVSYILMALIAFDIWKTLREALKTDVRENERRKRFIRNNLLAWTFPGVALIIILIIDQAKPAFMHSDLIPEYGTTFCGFGRVTATVIYYHLPAAVYMSLNVLFLLLAIITLLSCSQSEHELLTKLSQQMKLKEFVALSVLMNLICTFSIATHFVEAKHVYHAVTAFGIILGPYYVFAFTWMDNACKGFASQIF